MKIKHRSLQKTKINLDRICSNLAPDSFPTHGF